MDRVVVCYVQVTIQPMPNGMTQTLKWTDKVTMVFVKFTKSVTSRYLLRITEGDMDSYKKILAGTIKCPLGTFTIVIELLYMIDRYHNKTNKLYRL